MKRRLLLGAGLLAVAPAVARASDLQSFQRGTWQALREAHHGRPVVVHFWGLTCGPCLVELPEWGQFAQQRADVDMVTVAADPYPEPAAAVKRALTKAGLVGADNWMFDSFAERLRYEVDPAWQGELPMTVLIGRDGQIKTTVGVMDLADVRAWADAQKRSS